MARVCAQIPAQHCYGLIFGYDGVLKVEGGRPVRTLFRGVRELLRDGSQEIPFVLGNFGIETLGYPHPGQDFDGATEILGTQPTVFPVHTKHTRA